MVGLLGTLISFSQFNFNTLTTSAPISYSNRSNVVIENLRITNPNGRAINLLNCSNVTIRNCYFGPALNEGVFMENGTNITIENCLFANTRAGVVAVRSTTVKVLNSQFVNIHSSGGLGQFVQFNDVRGTGNLIQNNVGENFWAESNPEDLISVFNSAGTSASPILISGNTFRGGGPSGSGGGIMTGDYGSSYIRAENNRLVNPGQYGMGVAGGHYITFYGNKVYGERLPFSNVGIYVFAQAGESCGNITVSNNQVYWRNRDNVNNPWWTDNSCGFPIFDDGTNSSNLSLASMNMPARLITFVTEDQLWQIRDQFRATPSLTRPVANAGADKTVNTSSTSLTGSGGSSYRWVQVSGPNTSTIAAPTSATTSVTGLVDGVYVFRLEATAAVSSLNASDADWITVTVNNGAPAPNQPPTVSAGNDISITLPVNNTTLNGSGSDADGTVSYAWTRVSGPTTFTIASPNAASTALTGLVQGTYVFRLTATDDDGATTTDDVTVTVNAAANQTPTVSAGNDITITLPVNNTTLNGTGSDADGTITYAWTRVSGPTTFTIASPNAASTALTGLVQGTYVFRLTVTDDDGATASDNVTVTVNPGANQTPTVSAGNDITITLPVNNTTLNGTGSDADGTITYAWTRVSGPTTFTIASPNAASTALTGLVQGTYVFRLTVTDDDGATASDNVTVTVNAAANQTPTVSAGNDITITLPVANTTLNGTGSDADGTITYAWTRVSGPTTFTLAAPNAASTAVTGLVQGTYVFRLTVTDDDGATASDNVTVTVNAAANQPPTANAGNDISLTLPVNNTTLNGTGSDADGTITYAWTWVSGPATYTIASPNAASTALTGLVQGTYSFRLTVTDDDGATATDRVTVIVNPANNQAPTANAGNDISITLPVNNVTVNGSGTDADGTITYAWTRLSGPTTFTIANPAAASTAITGLVQGTYVFRLTVTDDDGATAVDNVSVTVNPAVNQSPTVSAGNDIVLTLPANSTTLNGSGNDADGTITYAWARVSGPTTFTIASPTTAVTALTGLVQGTYVFRLTVTDDDGATATDNVTVTVNPPANQAPTASAGNDIVLTLPANNTTLNGSGTDADGTITYAWTRVSGPTTFTIASPNAASTALTGLVQGVYVFRLTVTDDDGATATDNVTVTVNAAANQPPVANAGNDITITLPTNNATLNGSGSDPDGTVTYAWSRVSGPTTFTIASPNAAITSLTGLVQGTYVFRLTVTDDDGASATDNVTVTVNAAVTPPPAPNQAPTVSAGNNIVITLPVNQTTLNGSASDADGTIARYAWSRVSGPATFTITTPNAATTTLTGLVEGTYVFRLTATDDDGASASDQVTVVVNRAANQPPVANPGQDIVVVLPTNSATLNGSSSVDSDGIITSYEWEQVSGPTNNTLTNNGNAVVGVSNLQPGDYVYRLTVRDDRNGEGSATVKVAVVDNFRNYGPMAIYPNPADDFINIVVRSHASGTMYVRIYDFNGREAMPPFTVDKTPGYFSTRVNVSSLRSGMYVVVATMGRYNRMVARFYKR